MVWAHAQTVTRSKGRAKVTCTCNWQSLWLDPENGPLEEQISEVLTTHRHSYRLVEKARPRGITHE